MSAARVSLAVGALAAVAAIAGPVFALMAGETADMLALTFVQSLISFVYAGTGALIAARQPRNAVGWLLLIVGLCQGLSSFGYAYGAWAVPHGAALGVTALWLGQWIWAPSLALVTTLLLLLFPDGRPLSPRWRGPVLAAVILTTAIAVLLAGASWTVRDQLLADEVPLPPAVLIAGLLLLGAAVLLAVASVASLVLRFRRASGLQRMQIRWFALGGAVTVAGVALSFTGPPASPTGTALWLGTLLVGFTAVPASVAIAVLRYRLYEIDRVVSRTVAYALLTGVLLAVYGGGVLVLGRILAPAGRGSDLAVAGSTLLVAGLFQPVRGRIQGIVDRRFNRARYDAQRTVTAFAAHLRDAVDIDDLCAEMGRVVSQTVQPARLSVWLRTDAP